MRIVLFGDGAWAARSLLRLVEEGHSLTAAVVRARPSDRTLTDAADEAGVPVLQPNMPNGDEFLATMKALAPDLALSISYDRILRRPLLELPRLGCLNIHAGRLPEYRGRNVINWAILNGETEIGVTAHMMDEGIDTGDILLQRMLPIHWTDTYGEVLGRVVDSIPDLVSDAVRGLAEGTATCRPQPPGGTYFGGRGEGDEWLDWSDTSRNLYNKVRGISRPGPGARTMVCDRPAIIWRAEYDPTWPKYLATPGQVVGRAEGGGVIVKTGDSTLVLREVQSDAITVGAPSWAIGTRLGLDVTARLGALAARVAELEGQLSGRRNS
jgi:methionyl-tRNA formyltransferase